MVSLEASCLLSSVEYSYLSLPTLLVLGPPLYQPEKNKHILVTLQTSLVLGPPLYQPENTSISCL